MKTTKTKSTKTTKASKRVPQPEGDTTFRVVRLPAAIRDGIKDARLAGGANNQTTIAACIAAELPAVIESLLGLGAESLVEKSKSYRLPFSGETLDALREGSEQTGVPAAHLLVLCLSSLAGKPARKTKKGGR